MKSVTRLTGAAGVALAATALLTTPALAAAAHPASGEPTAAVFVQTDNPGGNAIISYDQTPDGTLHQAGTYPAGGDGGILNGSVVDHLASQGSLVNDRRHGLLYAVNAGSNTISVFQVAGDRLLRRQVIGSGGTFPVSIAVHGDLVYVLNARDGGSVQGFLRLGGGLVPVPAWHRDLGLNPAQTPEFTSTPGQAAFTPDGSKLIVTTKGNGNDVDVFGVGPSGGLAGAPVVTTLPNAVPFAVTFDARGHLVIAEAGPSALATFTVSRNGTLTAISQAATGQAATCWVTATGTNLYASNAGSGTLSMFADSGRGDLAALGTASTDPGTVDATVTADGGFLYVQTGADGIVDGFRINAGGSLTPAGSVTVPGAVGGEGIAAS